jgi:hypothetical protein
MFAPRAVSDIKASDIAANEMNGEAIRLHRR